MKRPLRTCLYSLLFAGALTRPVSADLLVNGTFTGVVDSGNKYTYGQFGNNSGATKGSTLTIPGWDTAGYNFVFTPGTVDQGDSTKGSYTTNKEAPGQYPASDGTGGTFMWGSNNKGITVIPTQPFSGNFVAADGAFQTGAITQTTGALTANTAYTLTFYWAAAQQQGFDGNTTEQWQVSLGSQSFKTPVYSLASHAFSPWMQQSFTFTPTTNGTELLSFLAIGTPGGEPPFVLLGGVNLVPEPSSAALLALVGLGLTGGWLVRRRRRLAAVDAEI